MEEKRTSHIHMKTMPSVKAMAEQMAAAEGRTLSNYIESIIQREYEKTQKKMEKYYLANYDSRMGGDFCEIYDEDLNFVRSVKGATSVQGLKEITKRMSPVSAFLETEPLNDQFDLVTGERKLRRDQIEKYVKNIIGKTELKR